MDIYPDELQTKLIKISLQFFSFDVACRLFLIIRNQRIRRIEKMILMSCVLVIGCSAQFVVGKRRDLIALLHAALAFTKSKNSIPFSVRSNYFYILLRIKRSCPIVFFLSC